MEKLMELLNEYEKKRIEAVNAKGLPCNIKLSFRPYTEESLTNKAYRSCWLEICSKYYGFIQRLVENEKIDFSREGDLSIELVNLFERKLDNSEGVIALLSIQDNPIEFLISILK